jgi:hypothetical protein
MALQGALYIYDISRLRIKEIVHCCPVSNRHIQKFSSEFMTFCV